MNFKGWRDTLECVESILTQTYTHYKILVVDNSPDNESTHNFKLWASGKLVIETKFVVSNSGTSKLLSSDWKIVSEAELYKLDVDVKLTWIKVGENRGFSAANNVAIRYVINTFPSDFIWLLNNDTVADTNALLFLVQSMMSDKNTKTGILGCKVMEYEVDNVIQSAGGGFLVPFVCYPVLIGAGASDSGRYDRISSRMNFVAGTSMFVRTKFIKDVGLMNEKYFLYFEEPDWAVRGRRLGWKINYEHKSIVYHKGGSSTGGKGYSSGKNQSTEFSDFYFQRAKILFAFQYFWHWLPILYLTFFAVIFNRIKRKQFRRIKMLLLIMLNPKANYSAKS